MGDQYRWVMLQCSAALDPDILSLDRADRWSWVGLMLYTRVHGHNGRLVLYTEGDGLSGVATYMGVPREAVEETIGRLPHVSTFRPASHMRERKHRDKPCLVVTWAHWRKYQHFASEKGADPPYPPGYPLADVGKEVLAGEQDADKVGTEESRVEKSRGEEGRDPVLPGVEVPRGTDPIFESCAKVLDLLNSLRGGRGLSLVGEGARNLRARVKEHGLEACMRVVRVKAAEWGRDPKMQNYLTLDTLFRPGHFDKYLSQQGMMAETPEEAEVRIAAQRKKRTEDSRRYIREINEKRRSEGRTDLLPEPPEEG